MITSEGFSAIKFNYETETLACEKVVPAAAFAPLGRFRVRGGPTVKIVYVPDSSKQFDRKWIEDHCPKSSESIASVIEKGFGCLLYTSPSPRDQRGSRMPSSA